VLIPDAYIPFFVSIFKSCDDLAYRIGGKTATGVVSSIAEQRSRYGWLDGYNVRYTFATANTDKQATGKTLVGVNQAKEYFVGRTLDIEYRGDDLVMSRIKGSGGWFWQAFLVVWLIAAVAFVIVMSVRTSREERKWRTRHRTRQKIK
jgi:hypothetical protein